MNHFIARRELLAASGLALLGLGGCRRTAAKPLPLVCDAFKPQAVNKKILFDRTTVLPDSQVNKLVRQLGQWPVARDHVQFLRFGGVTPSLVEEVERFELPADADTPEQRERDRWSKAPAQIERERACAAQQRQALQMESRLAGALHDVDASVEGLSPNFEAIQAAVLGWRGAGHELIVICDGVEHLSASRSFYGREGRLNLPDPQRWVEQLRTEGLLPELSGVKVYHLAIGLSEPATAGKPRRLRPYEDMHMLKQLWSVYWAATGASVSFGEPLFIDGLGA